MTTLYRRFSSTLFIALASCSICSHDLQSTRSETTPPIDKLTTLYSTGTKASCPVGECCETDPARFRILDDLGNQHLRIGMSMEAVRLHFGSPPKDIPDSELSWNDVKCDHPVQIWKYANINGCTQGYILIFIDGELADFGLLSPESLYSSYGRPGWWDGLMVGELGERYMFWCKKEPKKELLRERQHRTIWDSDSDDRNISF